MKDKEIILKGTRNYTDGIWDIPVQTSPITDINHTIPKNIHPGLYTTKEESDKSNRIISCLHKIIIESTKNSED